MLKPKLNLGCGTDIKEGYLNVDYIDGIGVDQVADLNVFPWPWPDNTFEEINMMDIFEHLENPIGSLQEIYRISQNGALIKIKSPHFSSCDAWNDLTHKHPLGARVFTHFLVNSHSTSAEVKRSMKFRLLKRELRFGRPTRWLGFGFIFSRIIRFYERNLYGIFPAENIYFELEVVKS